MKTYYVNKNAQANGDYEVHDENCKYLPGAENRINLGMHPMCFGAIIKAKSHYVMANGCYFCCKPCNIG